MFLRSTDSTLYVAVLPYCSMLRRAVPRARATRSERRPAPAPAPLPSQRSQKVLSAQYGGRHAGGIEDTSNRSALPASRSESRPLAAEEKEEPPGRRQS